MIIFYLKCRKSAAVLNEGEGKIITGLMEVLETRQWVLIEDYNHPNINDLNKLKLFVKTKILFAYQFVTKLSGNFLKDSFFKENTMIVFKIMNINTIRDFLNTLLTVSKKSLLT